MSGDRNDLDRAAKFEWDDGNSEKNWIRHRVSRQECEQVFFNRPPRVRVISARDMTPHERREYEHVRAQELAADSEV